MWKWVGRGYLDAAQGQAASHSRLYIFILELVQEAQEGLGKGGRADLARHWEPRAPAFASRKACLDSHPFPKDRAQ